MTSLQRSAVCVSSVLLIAPGWVQADASPIQNLTVDDDGRRGCLMNSMKSHLFTFPVDVSSWEVKTDGTERGGPSRAEIAPSNLPLSVVFQGFVGAIQGQDGLVGFALARVGQHVAGSTTTLRMTLESERPIVLTIIADSPLIKDADSNFGRMIFQARVQLRAGRQIVTIPWSEFETHVRGRPFPTGLRLSPESVTSLGLQINRSAQPRAIRNDPAPIRFRIGLLESP